jgi:hypothetical protein
MAVSACMEATPADDDPLMHTPLAAITGLSDGDVDTVLRGPRAAKVLASYSFKGGSANDRLGFIDQWIRAVNADHRTGTFPQVRAQAADESACKPGSVVHPRVHGRPSI